MKPRKSQKDTEKQEDLFQTKLEDIIDKMHPLARLADSIPWEQLDTEFGQMYRDGIGRPGHATRLVAGLHYLKEAFGVSDEGLMHYWVENPYWQYFCGMKYFEHKPPMDATTLGKWRKRIGPEKMEAMLQATVDTARKMKLLKAGSLDKLNVDTTVQEKAVRYPTDARLYHDMRGKLVAMAKIHGVPLRQSYTFLSKAALFEAYRYKHARQMKRARKHVKKLKTYLGRVARDIRRNIVGAPDLMDAFEPFLALADRLLTQGVHDRNKLYSIHAPEVECISKGKAHKKYEFGVKVGVVTTSREGFVVGIQAHHGNPYDGHTLVSCLEQTGRITGTEPSGDVFVDRGYRGHGYEGPARIHVVARISKNFSNAMRKWMKRRAAIEPEIGHMKAEGHLGKNHLAGRIGDSMNAVLCGCGHNIRKLLNFLRARPQLLPCG